VSAFEQELIADLRTGIGSGQRDDQQNGAESQS
jgi:hypothetical protein